MLAVVVCAAAQCWQFTINTTPRWQVARSIRLGEPMVTSDDVRQGFGIRRPEWRAASLGCYRYDRCDGRPTVSRLLPLRLGPIRRKQVVELSVAFLMQAFRTAYVLVLARRVLVTFGLGCTAAVAGSLALLLATTCLQYV
jgi:hypothetical protein